MKKLVVSILAIVMVIAMVIALGHGVKTTSIKVHVWNPETQCWDEGVQHNTYFFGHYVHGDCEIIGPCEGNHF